MENKITTQIGLVNINNEIEVDNTFNLNNQEIKKVKMGLKEYIKAHIESITMPYIIKHKYEKAKMEYHLQQRIDAIPDEDVTQPRLMVVGNVVDSLAYSLEEEQIREMFANLLVKEMNIKTQSKVLPAYIEIIKQLSMDDAKFIIELKKILCSGKIYMVNCKSLKYIVGKDINNEYHSILVSDIVLDNLTRLNFINCNITYAYVGGQEEFKDLEEYLKQKLNDSKYEFSDFKVTAFGKQFIEVCCS